MSLLYGRFEGGTEKKQVFVTKNLLVPFFAVCERIIARTTIANIMITGVFSAIDDIISWSTQDDLILFSAIDGVIACPAQDAIGI